jgi:hypothetical protein
MNKTAEVGHDREVEAGVRTNPSIRFRIAWDTGKASDGISVWVSRPIGQSQHQGLIDWIR